MAQNTSTTHTQTGQVICHDRKFPLVRLHNGKTLRVELATPLIKTKAYVVAGDIVHVSVTDAHDKGIVEAIDTRQTALVRKDPSEKSNEQVLAANFNAVFVVHDASNIQTRRLERELVLAYGTGAQVYVVLTKTDLCQNIDETTQSLETIVPTSNVVFISSKTGEGINDVRALIAQEELVLLLGKSGVGKSSLVNALAKKDVQKTQEVRVQDGKGRHTTVAREIIFLPPGGSVIDAPGIRSVGMWNSEWGIQRAFPDVWELAGQCKFRNCTHTTEPGCALLQAVASGQLSKERLASFNTLMQENSQAQKRLKESNWK